MRNLFLIILVMATFACSNYEGKVALSHPEEPTREELRNAMRFHGVLIAKQDENREWYFVRGGKRCPLFAYLKKTAEQRGQPDEKQLLILNGCRT